MEPPSENRPVDPPGSEPTPGGFSEPVKAVLVCPECEAELKNVRADPGQAVRCLNCGKRFVPVAAAEGANGSELRALNLNSNAESPKAILPARDVKTPGYWLLRIPAILLCVAGFVIAAMMFVSMIFSPMSLGKYNLLALLYVPLWPVGGLIAFWLTRAMARIDASMAMTLERHKRNASELPSPPGSSLPYILPMAVFGGAIPIVSITTMGRGVDGPVLFNTLVGFAVFYAAFALEDIRQFLWRQREYSLRFAGIMSGRAPTAARINVGVSSLMMMVVTISVFLFYGVISQMRYRDSTAMACLSIAFLGMGYSLGRLDREFTLALAQWVRYRRGSYEERICDEAGIPSVNEPWLLLNFRFFVCAGLVAVPLLLLNSGFNLDQFRQFYQPWWNVVYILLILAPLGGIALSLLSRRVRRWPEERSYMLRLLTILPVAATLLVALYLVLAEFGGAQRFFFGGEAFLLMGILIIASLFATMWMNEILMRITLWRRVLEQFPFSGTSQAELNGKHAFFLRCMAGLVLVQAVMFALIFFENVNRSTEVVLYLVLFILAHCPTIWLLMILFEVWHIERVVARRISEDATS